METRSKIFGPGLISFVFVLIFFTSNLALDNIKADDLIDQSIQSSMPADTIYSYNFEYGLNGWWVDNGVWEVGTPAGTAPCSLVAYSGNSCAGTNLNGLYPNYSNTRLISP
ncbi:MAG: hypothetical protein MUO78_04060, partial [candidate division Zixibacteria bacterium]|nr:hypothetical protein [candidate division Zixibacteria bacterium]